jgi:hypothetical protein
MSDPLKIHGCTLAQHAQRLVEQEARLVHHAISIGLTSGEDNTDIAHRVIGSRRLRGANGVTEITRRHLQQLGRGYLNQRKRKIRMSGA